MSTTDPYTHMEEAWKLDGNPFPSEGIRRPGRQEPFSPKVFPDETADFKRKLVRGAIQGGRSVGFLWSRGPGGDTGYGKTTLMEAAAREINSDLGEKVLLETGMRPERVVPIAAVYANLNNLDAAGLYPVLFQATVDAATTSVSGEHALVDTLRDRIVEAVGAESLKIEAALRDAQLRIAPGGSPLRPELTNAFATGGAAYLHQQLGQVSQASRLRSGLQYLDFLMAILAAAGVDHLFLFIDQLEDLAINKSITSAKRSREIGRIRDLLESEPYASRAHWVFTFHNSAAIVLERFWEQNRLPRFEIAPDNTASVVVLRGLTTDDQVAELLKVYLDEKRLEPIDDDLLPFRPDALAVLREVAQARVGIVLSRAHELLNAAAERGRGEISGDFAQQYFQGSIAALDNHEPPEEPHMTADLDELLLG
jgi:hypothetical protein